jgi:hypothetical protein
MLIPEDCWCRRESVKGGGRDALNGGVGTTPKNCVKSRQTLLVHFWQNCLGNLRDTVVNMAIIIAHLRLRIFSLLHRPHIKSAENP